MFIPLSPAENILALAALMHIAMKHIIPISFSAAYCMLQINFLMAELCHCAADTQETGVCSVKERACIYPQDGYSEIRGW